TETDTGIAGIKATMVKTAAEMVTPEYYAYRAAAEAAGKEPMEPLRWHILSQLGPLDSEDVAPPPKRPCKGSGSSEAMEEDGC
ncbi:MAG: hypothetical protein ACKPKO_23170, partial [Candidatus Fonsibacter sp.]